MDQSLNLILTRKRGNICSQSFPICSSYMGLRTGWSQCCQYSVLKTLLCVLVLLQKREDFPQNNDKLSFRELTFKYLSEKGYLIILQPWLSHTSSWFFAMSTYLNTHLELLSLVRQPWATCILKCSSLAWILSSKLNAREILKFNASSTWTNIFPYAVWFSGATAFSGTWNVD